MRAALILLASCLGATTHAYGQVKTQPIVEVRQRIIRAPESAIIDAVMKHGQGTAFAAEVQRMLAAGEARVVSTLEGATQGDSPLKMEHGRTIKWALACNENENNFTSTPKSYWNVLLGTSLEVAAWKSYVVGREPGTELAWGTHFSPRDPTTLEWPLVWPSKKEPGAGIFKQQDVYEEGLTVLGWAPASGACVLGFMRPADHVETGSRGEAALDVVLGEAHPQGTPAPAGTSATGSRANTMLLGFGVPAEDAQALLAARETTSDLATMTELLKRQRAGKAHLRVAAGLQTTDPRYDSDLQSIRRHSRPADTIVFPTYWEWDTGVGTQVRMQYEEARTLTLELTQSPCPPRRQTWQCATDSPEMTIWRPQFYEQTVKATSIIPADGVSLIAVIRTPDCLKGGEGLVPGETLLLFARLDETRSASKKDEPDAAAQLEGEAMVFELPVSEFDTWGIEVPPLEDQARFDKLLARVKEGTASLAGLASLKSIADQEANVNMVHQVEYCRSGDLFNELPGRFWPAAMDVIPAGTSWTTTVALPPRTGPFDFSAAQSVTLTYMLRHDVSLPRLPALDETLKHMAAEGNDRSPPPAVEHKAIWEGRTQVPIGKAHCLAIQKIPTADGDRVLVAFVRVRMVPTR